MAYRMAARVARIAACDAAVSNAVFSVASLCAPQTRMLAPSFLWAVIRGTNKPPLTAEQAIAQFPEFGDMLKPSPGSDPM